MSWAILCHGSSPPRQRSNVLCKGSSHLHSVHPLRARPSRRLSGSLFDQWRASNFLGTTRLANVVRVLPNALVLFLPPSLYVHFVPMSAGSAPLHSGKDRHLVLLLCCCCASAMLLLALPPGIFAPPMGRNRFERGRMSTTRERGRRRLFRQLQGPPPGLVHGRPADAWGRILLLRLARRQKKSGFPESPMSCSGGAYFLPGVSRQHPDSAQDRRGGPGRITFGRRVDAVSGPERPTMQRRTSGSWPSLLHRVLSR